VGVLNGTDVPVGEIPTVLPAAEALAMRRKGFKAIRLRLLPTLE